MIVENLLQFGLNEKEISVYLGLISLGPSSVRLISNRAQVNRGTTYDILKDLMKQGLVSYYKHGEKKQYFVAEPPQKLLAAIESKRQNLEALKLHINKALPELESLYEKSGAKPVVKYYEGQSGVRIILQDVLETMSRTPSSSPPIPPAAGQGEKSTKESFSPSSGGGEREGVYYVYSSADIREYLYKAYKDFNKDRLKNNIAVKVIAIGRGGELAGLDERKWLSQEQSSPTYVLIYGEKLAMITIDATKKPVGVIVEDQGLYQTQEMIFKKLWNVL